MTWTSTENLLQSDLIEQAHGLTAPSLDKRLFWIAGYGDCSLPKQVLYMFGSWFWIVGKAADLGRNGQEQNQEAQRNHGTHLHVLFLLPLRTSWKFSAVSRLSLASSGYSW